MSRHTTYGGSPTRLMTGAAAIIPDARGHILLQRRSDNGMWGLPGGAQELGESLAQTVCREVLEETGLVIEVVRLVGVYSKPPLCIVAYPDGNVIQFVSALFLCRVTGGSLRRCEESLELDWFDPAALPEPFVPNHRRRVADYLSGVVGGWE